MHTRRQFGIRLAALSAMLGARGLPAFAAEQTLRCGSISVEGSPTYAKLLVPYARAIEHESGGRLEVALLPAGGYGKATDLLPMVEKGEIEMASTVQGYYPGRFLETSVIELPLLFDNSVAGTKALTALNKENLLGKDYATFKAVGLNVAPLCALFTTGKKIVTLKDLRGLRVRVPGPTVGLALAKVGAIPLGIPVNMMGDAIAKGMVDAIALAMDSTLGTKGAGGKFLYEQLSVVVDMRFAAPAQLIAMNQAKWDALLADLQAVIEKCTATYISEGARQRDEWEVEARKKLQADPRYTFVPWSQQLHDEMQQAMMPAYDDWKADMAKRGIDGERLLARTRELVKQFSIASN